MAQIKKKFIEANAVDETKIKLSNNATLKARNAANSADIDIVKVNASDRVEFPSAPQTASAPATGNDLANKTYVDSAVGSATPAASAVTYSNTTSGLVATNVQSAIDEIDGRVDTTEAKIGHLETLSGVASGSNNLGTFTGTTIADNDTIKQALQDLETAVELRALDSVVIKKDGSVAFTADQSMGGHKLTNLADPTANGDAVTLSYMNARLNGVKPKQAVRAATTVAGTLASSFANGSVIDTVTLATGDRILIKNQAAPAENGIYVVAASGAPTRATDFDSTSPVDEINGAWVAIQEGSQAGQIWVQFGTVTTVGTDAINFEYFNPLAGLIGGDMITFAGSTFSVDLATVSGLESSNPGNAAGQLRVKLEAVNPSLQIDGSNQLGAKLDAAGAITSGASGLKVGVDAVTSKINGSNQLESLKENEETITLAGADITNQYVDLAHATYGASAAVNSVSLSVVGGPIQEKTVDYTVALTGGTGGVTRITFAGDLATLGNAALVAGDKLVVKYSYL